MTHGGRDDHVRDAAARRSQECRAAGEYATGSPHAAGIVGIFSSSRSPSRGNIMTTITAIAPDAILPDTFRIPEQQAEQADWSVGPVTGHRVRVLLSMTLATLGLYRIQHEIWPRNFAPVGPFMAAWSWTSLLWLGAVLPGLTGLLGMLRYRHPAARPVSWVPQLVSWRIVSRGTNVAALTATIRRCQAEMARTPLFPYVIEVVTDTQALNLPAPNDDISYIVVPPDYQTPGHSLYKARALHYAVQHSSLPADAWIVHLDEETQPTASGIRGIARMISEEEASGQYHIGQGAILYHRDWRKHPFLTLADNVRTGDDFARFHFAHRLGVTVFGLHGSYIVVRNSVETGSGGFDFGPHGSITEDAFWALMLMEQGYRIRWVEGYLEEQSCQTVADFVKQRRRWFQGLAKVALFAPVKLRWRLTIGINSALWVLAPFAIVYTAAHFALGGYVEPWIRLLANMSFASFITLYITGLKANLDEHGMTRFWARIFWHLAQIVLLPVFTLMEGSGVVLGLTTRNSGFHVVRK